MTRALHTLAWMALLVFLAILLLLALIFVLLAFLTLLSGRRPTKEIPCADRSAS